MNVDKQFWGRTRDGQIASSYLLRNSNGMEVEVSDFGASILAIRIPDDMGEKRDVLLGYDTLEEYYDNACGFGAYIGRNANRIGNAEVTINGVGYQLEANSHGNNLHSGSNRSHYQFYNTIFGGEPDGDYVEFSRTSPHLEQGFPGNLQQIIRYTLTEKNELRISYCMKSDKATVINPTNHSYFNLGGHDSGDVLGHVMEVYSDSFLLTDANLLPTGKIASVEGTPMDFRKAHTVGERIGEDYEPLKLAGGYDHNYILPNDKKLKKVAKIVCPETGITMEVETDRCGMQVYSGNFLNGKHGKDGAVYRKRAGICFETQFYPNSCKQPGFPSCIFKGGEEMKSTTVYRFIYA